MQFLEGDFLKGAGVRTASGSQAFGKIDGTTYFQVVINTY